MKLDRARRHRRVDIVLLACVIGLAITTWATLSQAEGVPAVKVCFCVAATMVLALAALTPHEPRAAAMRLVMSGWLWSTPWLLAVADVSVVRWSYLTAGSLIAALSMPRFLCHMAPPADQNESPA